MSGVVLDDVLSELERAMSAAQAVPLACRGPDELRAAAAEVQRLRARLDAWSGSLLAAVGDVGERAGVGGRPRSVASIVAADCGADPRAVAAEAHRAGWLCGFPRFAEAHATGALSARHVTVLRRLDGPRTHAALVESQEILIEAATSCLWREFVEAARYWRLAADPDGPEPLEQLTRRFCRITKHADGTVSGRFRLDPVGGEAVVTAVGRAEQALFRDDGAEGSLRSPSQRRADALVELIARGAGPGGGKPARPLVHVVMSERVVEALLAGRHPGLDPTDVDRRCELVDGTPLDPRIGAGVLAGATFRRLVLGSDHEVLDLGRRVRRFPAHLREALLAAGRGRCRIPGCDAPPSWLQVDHIHPWHRAGPTSTANGQILCDPHNKAKGASVDDGPETMPTDRPGRQPRPGFGEPE